MSTIGIFCAALALQGCGGDGIDRVPVVEAAGKVYVDDQPYGPATLTLRPVTKGQDDKRPPLGGLVETDGSFKLTTYEPGDGAPPGEYTVSLSPRSEGAGGDPSVDPAAMMASISEVAIEDTTVTVPEDGSTSLEIRAKKKAGGDQGGQSTLLGQ
jgi:hypothetical protein